MPRVTLLGSAATVAGRENDSIYLLLQSADGDYMIDCGGSAPHKLARAGAELARLRGVLLTHDHADHTGGNENLGKAGAVIFSHDNVRERLTVETVIDRLLETVPAPGD